MSRIQMDVNRCCSHDSEYSFRVSSEIAVRVRKKLFVYIKVITIVERLVKS